jgi:hypothetical protein
VGWFNLILKYEGYEWDLIQEFVRNFHINFIVVRGETIDVSTSIISALSIIPLEGEIVILGQHNLQELL